MISDRKKKSFFLIHPVDEIKKAVRDEVKDKMDLITNCNKNNDPENERLITHLYNEIKYLKQELLSKNTTIDNILKVRELTKYNELKKSKNIINEQPLNISATKNIITISSDVENIEDSDIEEKKYRRSTRKKKHCYT